MQPQAQATGQLINTQPTAQTPADPNVASLAMDPTQQANEAKANLGFVTTMQDHLAQYKSSQNTQKSDNKPDNSQKKPQQNGKMDMQSELDSVKSELKTVQEEIKAKSVKDEIQAIRDELEGLLQEDSNGDNPNQDADQQE